MTKSLELDTAIR